MLEQIVVAMLGARAAHLIESAKLYKWMLDIVRRDAVCRRLTSTPRGWSVGGDHP
jgi:hypothetical protein